MSKKVICTVTNDLAGDQRMHKTCTSLTNAGYDVLLVGRLRSSSKELPLWSFQTKRIRCSFNQGKLFYLEYNLRLFFFLLFAKADIQTAVDTDTLLANYWSSLFRGRKLVFDAHEYFTEVPELVGRKFSQFLWRIVERLFIPKHAYTVNASLAELFKQKYKVKFEVIRNLPRLQDLKIGERSGIIYQGAVNMGRGLKELIQVMPEIDEHLHIYGTGDIDQELKILVKELSLQDKVTFHGFVPMEELREKTLNAKIGVNLLENKGLSYYYSLANKFSDYIECGLPQISMNFPEYSTLNKQFGVAVLLKDLSEKPLIYSLNKLLLDKEFYHSVELNCLSARKDLNWEQEEKKLITFYNAI